MSTPFSFTIPVKTLRELYMKRDLIDNVTLNWGLLRDFSGILLVNWLSSNGYTRDFHTFIIFWYAVGRLSHQSNLVIDFPYRIAPKVERKLGRVDGWTLVLKQFKLELQA